MFVDFSKKIFYLYTETELVHSENGKSADFFNG